MHMRCKCGYRPKGTVIDGKLRKEAPFLLDDLNSHININHDWMYAKGIITPNELIINTEKEDALMEAIKRGEKVDLEAVAKIPRFLVEIEMVDKRKPVIEEKTDKNTKLVEWM